MHIKDINGTTLFESNHNTIKETAEAAVQQGINLTEANLRGAELTGTNLTKANLARADLTATDFTGANLLDTILTKTALAVTRETLVAEALKRLTSNTIKLTPPLAPQKPSIKFLKE